MPQTIDILDQDQFFFRLFTIQGNIKVQSCDISLCNVALYKEMVEKVEKFSLNLCSFHIWSGVVFSQGMETTKSCKLKSRHFQRIASPVNSSHKNI